MGQVTITNSNANPDPAPISKGQNPNNKTITFQTSDNNTKYKLSGMSSVLDGTDPVTIWKGTPSGTYTVKSGASGTGTYTISIVTGEPGLPGDGSAQIQIDP